MTASPATETIAVTLTRRHGYAFDADFGAGVPGILLDELPPIGDGEGPNPSRLLAASVGHCLSASLLFCLRKQHLEVGQLRTTVEATVERNERGRLRVSGLRVRIDPGLPADQVQKMARCRELFEEYCLVTESVRKGIPVEVEVAPPMPAVG